MGNYKNIVNQFVSSSRNAINELHNDGDISFSVYQDKMEALEITQDFFGMAFDREFKQYNQDEAKAYDFFIFKKYLDMFDVYVISMADCYKLFPDRYSDSTKKELRRVLSQIQSLDASEYI